MNNEKFEFIRYDAANAGEKHLGVATIKIYGKFIVRVKEIFTKNGVNTFLAPPAVKIGDDYEKGFEIDSKSEQVEFDKFVQFHIAEFKKNLYRPVQQQQSSPQYQHQNLPGVPF